MMLKDLLKERTDFDMTMFHLACCLGMMEFNNFGEYLGTLNSKNGISDFLYEML